MLHVSGILEWWQCAIRQFVTIYYTIKISYMWVESWSGVLEWWQGAIRQFVTIYYTIKTCYMWVESWSGILEWWQGVIRLFVTIYYTIKIFYMYFTEWKVGVVLECNFGVMAGVIRAICYVSQSERGFVVAIYFVGSTCKEFSVKHSYKVWS